jgi:hypothetical protein
MERTVQQVFHTSTTRLLHIQPLLASRLPTHPHPHPSQNNTAICHSVTRLSNSCIIYSVTRLSYSCIICNKVSSICNKVELRLYYSLCNKVELQLYMYYSFCNKVELRLHCSRAAICILANYPLCNLFFWHVRGGACKY